MSKSLLWFCIVLPGSGQELGMACLFYSPLEDGAGNMEAVKLWQTIWICSHCFKRSDFLLEIRGRDPRSYL